MEIVPNYKENVHKKVEYYYTLLLKYTVEKILFKHHPTIYWTQNIFNYSLVNPILGVQFKFKDEILNLKDFLPDSKIQSSKWMVMVNLNASLYQSTTCIDNSLQRNEYQEVLQVIRLFYSNISLLEIIRDFLSHLSKDFWKIFLPTFYFKYR